MTKERGRTFRIPRTELVVSRIAYGTVQVGWGDTVITDAASFYREIKEPLKPQTLAKAVELISAAYDNGITLFDLADIYAAGKAESAFGEVLRRCKGLREKIVIQTKCGWYIPDGPREKVTLLVDTRRDHIISAVHASLRRLGTDYVDLLLLHVPNALVEPDEVADAFEQLLRLGKVRYFGVQDHSPFQIELLKKSVRVPLVVNQVGLSLQHCHLLAQGAEPVLRGTTPTWPMRAGGSLAGTIEYCQLHDIQVQAYSPLLGDLIKATRDISDDVSQAAEVLQKLAESKQTSPAALALAWLLHHPAGIVPIFGTRNVHHVAENCSAYDVTLTDEEWYQLFGAAAAGIRKRTLM